jgi:hypothetical protein
MMGMVDMNDTEQMMVFPNPANDKLYIQNKNIAPGQYQLSLMDVFGTGIRLSDQYICSNTIISFDLKQFPSAIYILQLRDSKGVLNFSKQVVVVNR